MFIAPRTSDPNLCPSDNTNCMGANTPADDNSTPAYDPSQPAPVHLRNFAGLIIVLALLVLAVTFYLGCRRWKGRPEWCCGPRTTQAMMADSERKGPPDNRAKPRESWEKPAIVVVAPADMDCSREVRAGRTI